MCMYDIFISGKSADKDSEKPKKSGKEGGDNEVRFYQLPNAELHTH